MLKEEINSKEIIYIKQNLEFLKYLFETREIPINTSLLKSSITEYGILIGLTGLINNKVKTIDSKIIENKDLELIEIYKLQIVLTNSESYGYSLFVKFFNKLTRESKTEYNKEIGEINRIRKDLKSYLEIICFDPIPK